MTGDPRNLRDRAKATVDQVVGRTEEILAEAYGESAAEVHGEALRLRGEAVADAALSAEDQDEATARQRRHPDARSDGRLRTAVADELSRHPQIDRQAVAVGVDGGVVTLRGTVATTAQKRAAAKAARTDPGVRRVDNGLHVEPLPAARRPDAHLRATVLQSLLDDPRVPASVDARVANGRVTLTGTVEWSDQRDSAVQRAGEIAGVAAVADELLATDTTHVGVDVENGIRTAFLRRATLHADRVTVAVSEGTVTLLGQVLCRDEHDAAVAAAWAHPSVRSVDDHLTVAPG